MMLSTRTTALPHMPSEELYTCNRKFALKKNSLLLLQEKSLGWSPDCVDTTGANFVAQPTDCLWYIDGHINTLNRRSCSIPNEFLQFQGYNTPVKSKHRKCDPQNLSAAKLDNHSNLINNFLLQPWFDSGV